MKRVLKYPVPLNDRAVQVPRGVPVLFEPQRDPDYLDLQPVVMAWFEVYVPGHDFDPATYQPETQWVKIVGTNRPVPDDWQWLASCVDGSLVWHLYSVPEKDVRA